MPADDGPIVMLPAPGRGQYDRRLPRERRLAEQRERLVQATARAFAFEDAPGVAAVTRIAGVGRNTFYEFFDDVPHARKAAEAGAFRIVEQALRAAEASTRTPVERFRALTRAWFDACERTPSELLLALRPSDTALSRAAALLEAALARALSDVRALGVTIEDREPLRATAVAASAEALGRAHAKAVLLARRAASVESGGAAAPARAVPRRERLERVVVDAAVRLLR